MKLEKQVCSLEYAKKLKELGIKQESLFYWIRSVDNRRESYALKYNIFAVRSKHGKISAFTVAELGEMLPENIKNYPLQICRSFDGGWFVGYGDHMNGRGFVVEDGNTEANARAKMLIYLIENKLIETKRK